MIETMEDDDTPEAPPPPIKSGLVQRFHNLFRRKPSDAPSQAPGR